MKNSIMIITNNKEISGQMHTHLSSPCTTVIIVPTMSEALPYLTKFDCCLIILDAAISADDDHQLLSTMTKLKTIPILILSSQTCPVERLQVLRAGAHAYIGHPYSPEECLAQAQALIQLYCDLKPQQETGHTVSIGKDLVVDPLSRQVLLNGKDIRLTREDAADAQCAKHLH